MPAGLIAFSGFVPTVDGWSPELEGRERPPASRSTTARTTRSSRSTSRGGRAELLHEGGIEPAYLETDAGHWLPPEALEPGRNRRSDRDAVV